MAEGQGDRGEDEQHTPARERKIGLIEASSVYGQKRKREEVKGKEKEKDRRNNNNKRKRKTKDIEEQNKIENKKSCSDDVNLPVSGSSKRQHAPLHVGIDRINSNWKQIQSTLKRSRYTFGKFQTAKDDKQLKASAKNQDGVQQAQMGSLAPKSTDCSLTKVLAMDCEMVGAGLDGKRSILARVSLVNMWGNIVYDKHVRPMEKVTDFRTKVSGVRPSNLRKAEEFAVVQKEVADLIAGRILVGHAVKNDLKIMYLSHPKKNIRDTAAYLPLRSNNGRPKALRHIAAEILGVTIQDGEHCSVQDARAAMYIYHHVKHDWERAFLKRRKSEDKS